MNGEMIKGRIDKVIVEMMKAAYNEDVPFSWVTADSVYGDYQDIGMWLESIAKGYVMAVSDKAYVWPGFTQHRASAVLEALPEEGWKRIRQEKGRRVRNIMIGF